MGDIMATSPLGTIPNPIIRESFPNILKNFAGIPQPTTLVIIASIVRTTKNQSRLCVSVVKSAITPRETKNIAAKIIWRYSAPFRKSLEWMSCELPKDIPAINVSIILEVRKKPDTGLRYRQNYSNTDPRFFNRGILKDE
jgi:hypothetical protein